MNLFESLNNIIDQDFLDKVKANTTDNLGDTETAVKGIYYTLVAGLIRRCNSDMSAGMLFNQVNDNYKKSKLNSEWKNELTDKNFINQLINDGTKIISHIFPAYKSPLLSMIGSYAGTSKNTTVLVSGITSVLLVDFLGEKIKTEKWDKDQMVYFLKQHHEILLKDAPESLMEKMVPALGLQELVNTKIVPVKKPEVATKPNLAETVKETTSFDNEDDNGTVVNKKVILGILIGAIIAALAYFYWVTDGSFGIERSKADSEETIEDELAYADSLNNVVVDSSANTVKDTLQKTGTENDVEKEFAAFESYLSNSSEGAGKSFDFRSIQYVDKTFDLTSESTIIINRIAEKMKENSRLQIKITAFSEEGDLKLNNKRAFAVKKVLIGTGIEPIRIDAASGGKGGNFPQIKVVSK